MSDKVNKNIPVDGDLSIKNEKGSRLSRITNKHIYDKSGKKVATFDKTTKNLDKTSGKKVRVHSYRTSTGTYELIKDKLFRNGKMVGKTKFKEKFKVILIIIISILLLLASLSLGLLYLNQRPITVKIGAGDANGVWNEKTKVGVFDPQIKPGSEGEYEFYVVNESSVTLTYSFTIQEMFNYVNVYDFPMQYQVTLNDEVVHTWSKGTDVKVDNIIVEPNEKHSFVLEWRWLFDGGNDTIDTYYGTDGGIYSIYLNLFAEQYMEE